MSSVTEYAKKRKERRERLEIRKNRFKKGDKVFCIKHTWVNSKDFTVRIKKTHPGVIYTVGYNIGGTLRIVETNENIHHSKFISLFEYRMNQINRIRKRLKKKQNDNNTSHIKKT